MPERFVRRIATLDGNGYQRNNANTIRVDSTVNLLKFGSGSSGTVEKTVQTLDGIAPVSVTGTTLALTAAAHAGQTVVINSASGCAITLPAATGSGAKYNVFVGTTLTSGSLSIAVASSTDYMRGEAYTFSGATASTFGTSNTGTVATESDTITFNRTTTGLGTQGDFLEFWDLAAGLWAVEADYASSGTAATPFTAAV